MIQEIFTDSWQMIWFVVEALIIAYIGILLFDVRTKFDENHLVIEESNLAVALRKGAILLGLGIGLSSSLVGPVEHLWNDTLAVAIHGAVILVCLFVAGWINDKFLLIGVKNDKEIEAGNSAVGFFEIGSYLATGMILKESFGGDNDSIWNALIFFLEGQLFLVIFFKLYELVTPFNLVELVKDKNDAAGVAVGAMLTSLGFILSASIGGPFTGLLDDVIAIAIGAVQGIILLLIIRLVAAKLFLPKASLKDEIQRDRNAAAVVQMDGFIITAALITAAVVL
jgi:uncharacterized membrane protein YjfL (UPF0719 family)